MKDKILFTSVIIAFVMMAVAVPFGMWSFDANYPSTRDPQYYEKRDAALEKISRDRLLYFITMAGFGVVPVIIKSWEML